MNLHRPRALISTAAVILLVLAIWPASAQAATLKVRQISAGFNFTCAVTTNNEAWCWGHNPNNEVGDLTLANQNRPVRVHRRGGGLLGNIGSVSAGTLGACAVDLNGAVWCWGWGFDYPPMPPDERGASKVAGIGAATQVSVGNSICARTKDGAGWCWGDNVDGEVGDGNTYSAAPTRIFSEGIVSIQGNSSHGCALKTDHGVWCWGQNRYGELGDGTQTQRLSPVQVKSASGGYLTGVATLGEANGEHQCAVLGNGQPVCWGLDGVAQIGDGGTNTQRLLPVHVLLHGANLSRVTAVSTGYGHSCALRHNQTVWCWGWGEAGQLGTGGVPAVQRTPTKVHHGSGYLGGIASISAGETNTCAITNNGVAWCWGSNGDGALGIGSNETISRSPVQVKIPG